MPVLSLHALQIQDFYSADITQLPKSVGVSPNTSWMIRSLKKPWESIGRTGLV